MDIDHLAQTLPIDRRLALSYAPRTARPATLALFAFDAVLAQLVRSTREPMLGQLRLAWWREELGKPAQQRARGEPVLQALDAFAAESAGLAALVDGWEGMLGDAPLTEAALLQFAAARGEACGALARVVGAQEYETAARTSGHDWALAELGTRLSDPSEQEIVRSLSAQREWQALRMPRALRSLRVLHGLALKGRGHRPLLSRRRDLLTAFRLGLLGI